MAGAYFHFQLACQHFDWGCLARRDQVYVLRFSPCLPSTQSEADARRVEAYILATKSHACSSEGDGKEDDEDLRLFLDIDMSVLGQPRDGELMTDLIGLHVLWWMRGIGCPRPTPAMSSSNQR